MKRYWRKYRIRWELLTLFPKNRYIGKYELYIFMWIYWNSGFWFRQFMHYLLYKAVRYGISDRCSNCWIWIRKLLGGSECGSRSRFLMTKIFHCKKPQILLIEKYWIFFFRKASMKWRTSKLPHFKAWNFLTYFLSFFCGSFLLSRIESGSGSKTLIKSRLFRCR